MRLVRVNKPKAPSPTAKYAPTEHSKTIWERLGELRSDLVSERYYRRRLTASSVATVVGILAIGGEISAIATGLVADRRLAVAIVFAASSAASLGGIFVALGRPLRIVNTGELVSRWCLGLLASAIALAVAGAFLAAWP
jgi:hypothetical protein